MTDNDNEESKIQSYNNAQNKPHRFTVTDPIESIHGSKSSSSSEEEEVQDEEQKKE